MSKIMYAIWLFSITPFNPAQRQTTTPRTRRGKHSAISRIPLAVSWHGWQDTAPLKKRRSIKRRLIVGGFEFVDASLGTTL
jgi:hypothetical protein